MNRQNRKRIPVFLLSVVGALLICLTINLHNAMAEPVEETDDPCEKMWRSAEIDLGGEYRESDPLVLTYGTEPVEIPYSLKSGSEPVTEALIRAEITVSDGNEDKVRVLLDQMAGRLVFSPEKVSDSPFAVELSLQTESCQCSKRIYVRVVPYPLVIDDDSVKVSAPGKADYSGCKTYDASGLVDVLARLKADGGLETTDAARREIAGFSAVVFADYDSKIINVREGMPQQTFRFAPPDLSAAELSADLKNNYTIKAGEEARATVHILRRVLELTVTGTSRGFRSLTYAEDLQSLVSVKASGKDTGFAGADSDLPDGFVYPAVVDTTAAGMTEETIKTGDSASFGRHAEALILDFTDSNATGNYVFNSAEYGKGTLDITEEADGSGYVSVDNAAGTHVYEREDKSARFYGKDAEAIFTLDGGYTRICLADGTDITESGIALEPANRSGEPKAITVYLTREEIVEEEGGDVTVVKAKTAPFDIVFIYDQDAPVCEKIDFGVSDTVVSDLSAPVTFGVYDNRQIEAGVSFADDRAGMKGWSYYVANTAKDARYEELLPAEADADDYAETLANSCFIAGPEDCKIRVGTLAEGQDPEEGNAYVVFVKTVDNVGNVKICGSNGVVLENLRDISVEFEEKSRGNSAPVGIWNGISYYSGNAELLVRAEENAGGGRYYSGLDWMKYTVSVHCGDGKTETEPERTVDKEKPENVTLSGLKEYCAIHKDLSFMDDYAGKGKIYSQVITVNAWASDNAGNAGKTAGTHTLVLDSVAPVVTSSFVQENNRELSHGQYANSKVTYTAAVRERFLKELFVNINGEAYTLTQLQARKASLGIGSVVMDKKADITETTDESVYSFSVEFAADGEYTVFTTACDAAGNRSRDKGFCFTVDTAPPEVEVIFTAYRKDGAASAPAPSGGHGFTDARVYSARDNPGFRVYVTEPAANGARSGLKRITYRIVSGTDGVTETGTLAELEKTAHAKQWTGHLAINADKFCSDDVQVTVYVQDWSANETVSERIRVKVDNKAPVVKFAFDRGDVHNGKYYRNGKKLVITVKERNFDASSAPEVTCGTGGRYRIGQWKHDGEIHTAVITFTGDSAYTVTYDCCDLAGNKADTERLDEFIVDKTAPVISVAYDNNSALGRRYYKESRTAIITVTEHNFDPGEIQVNVSASAGNPPKPGVWTSRGDTHTAKISFARDADYMFSVGGLDLAGNQAAVYGPDRFTADLAAPEIVISGVEDKSANNGTVAPVITVRDANFAADGVRIRLKGANTGERKVSSLASVSADASGMTVSFKDFAGGMDDIYTLSCEAVDRAGNMAAALVRFSVNRDGSVYGIHQETQKLLEKGCTNRPQDIVITEINPDPLKWIGISCSLEGRVVILKEGIDYTVEADDRDGRWKKYVYRIRAACFAAEGAYMVNICSEDGAGNITTNKSKAKPVAFIVDKTAPAMAVANLEDGGRYKEETHQFTLNVRDNIFLDRVELYLDGRLAHTYEGDEVTVAGGELLIDIPGRNQYQTIELTARDRAGNIGREAYGAGANARVAAAYRVLVTADPLVQYVNNTPLFAASMLLALPVIFSAFILSGRGRQRRNSQKQRDKHSC